MFLPTIAISKSKENKQIMNAAGNPFINYDLWTGICAKQQLPETQTQCPGCMRSFCEYYIQYLYSCRVLSVYRRIKRRMLNKNNLHHSGAE